MSARKLLTRADLKEGTVGKSLLLASCSKSHRHKVLLSHSEEAKIAAAIEIQRVYRGYSTRCRLLHVVEPKLSKTAVCCESQEHVTRLHDVRTPSPTKRTDGTQSEARVRLQQYYENYVTKTCGADPIAARDIPSFEDFCALYIQNWWHHVKKTKDGKSYKSTSQKPEREKRRKNKPLTPAEAAVIIQRAWRRHIDVQVFEYYRDLISFRNRGDPAMMLRCINPNEAKLLDAAAGIHIKFRLAGDRFPPNIYYKIFTHRPVQDLCANSPKDYTKPDTKRRMARDVHNKGNRVQPADQTGWYSRIENNGWRLVSDRLTLMSDPITYETSRKKVDFHHNKLKRKEDVEKNRKRKKVEWMKKMYKQGMLKSKVKDAETVELIEGAAAGMVATIDQHGPDSVQEWEVEELLDWTTSLNFDDYLTTWKEAATSANSEKPVHDRVRMQAAYSSTDPFELTVTFGSNKRDGSTRQSHNTPVSNQSMGSFTY